MESATRSESKSMALVSVGHSGKAAPGQFYMIKCGDFPVVPRPYSVFYEDLAGGTTTFLIKARGLQTSQLVEMKPGDVLKIRGPLGSPFPSLVNAVLVAGGCGFAPLHFYARQYGYSSFFLGTETYEELAFLCLFDDLKGTHGDNMVTDLFMESPVDGPLIACGPSRMLRTLSETDRKDPVYVSLESRMACGTGMCLGCPAKMKDGTILFVCKDGPVFSGRDVDWEWLT